MSKSIQVVLGALLCAVVGLALAGPANAAFGYQRTGVFAQTVNDGTGVVQTHNGRIAVKTSTGDVYETDTVNDRIDVYRPNSTDADPLTTFGTGDLTDPYGIAVDQSTGDVYVSDSGNSRVQRFTSDNAATPAFTLDPTPLSLPGSASALAFDQAAGELVYIDPSSQQIRRADTAGTAFTGDTSGAAFTSLQDLAVTSTGEIIVVDSTGDPAQGSGESRVERFAADGAHNGSLGPVAGAATVAVIANGDRIAVSGAQDNINNVAYATLSVFTNDGALESTTSSGEQYSIVTGLAADDGANGRLYVASDATPPYGYMYGNASVQAYEPFPLPTVGTPTVSAVTGNSAHLSATIDPQGGTTTYRFETSTDANSWTAIDPDTDGDEDAGSGTGDVTVAADAVDLPPNTAYYVRVIATKNGVGVISGQVQFTSGVIVATVAYPDHAPYQPYEDEAYLNAKVNPRHAPVSVHFEYGPTTAYGQTTNSQSIPAGDSSVAIIHHIRDLTPGTTYHFRIVATNGAGETTGADQSFTTLSPPGPDTCPNAAIRAQQHTQGLADCRAFEQVSPVDKNGVSVSWNHTVQASPGGDAVAYAAPGAFPGAATNLLNSYYIGRRSATGWATDPIDAPQANSYSQIGAASLFLTSDLSSTMQFSERALAGGVEGGGNLYLRDNLTGSRTLAASASSFLLENNLVPVAWRQPVAASTDLSHFAFTTEAGGLVPEIPNDGGSQAYETVNGSVRLVGYLPDGSIPPSSIIGTNFANAQSGPPLTNAVSADGRRIFFESPARFGALYVRVDGTTTVPISVSHRTGGPTEPQPATFLGASKNGDVVYFTTDINTPLTDDDIGGLYRYHLDTGVLDHLTSARYDSSVGGRMIVSVPAISADGSTAYFLSPYNLADGATGGGLYVVRNGELSFVGKVVQGPNAFGSPDGRFFVFASSDRVTGYDNENPACHPNQLLSFFVEGVCSEVFRYDAETKKLDCLSCLANPAGSRHSHLGWPDRTVSDYGPRGVLNDGRVFFSTGESLVAGDVNGRQDVYVWRDGVARLISDGRAAADATFADASADGRDVFFTTSARLAGSDTDDEVDLYDARQGGGLSAQNDVAVTVAPCTEDGCQGVPESASGREVAGSVSFVGAGDGSSAGSGAGVVKPKVSGPRAVRGVMARLMVKVPGRGRISTSGPGLSSSSITAGKAGSYRVAVRLSQRSQRTLKRKHRLTVRVVVRFTPATGRAQSVGVSMTFKTITTTSTSSKKGRS
jgi:sugar lactone lactonase YvrE